MDSLAIIELQRWGFPGVTKCRHRSIEFLTTQADQTKRDILIDYVLILEIAITTQTPPHVSWKYKLDCVVHKFIVGKLVFMAINALYIRCKILYKVRP